MVEGAPLEGGKRSAWMTHVKKTMRAHKGMKLMQVLKLAKKTYKKSRRGGAASSAPTGVAAGASPLTGGKTRKGRSRKGRSRKH